MNGLPLIERDAAAFPRAGFRARRWQRFERDLGEWLATPEGRFAAWRARRVVAGRAVRVAHSRPR